jgi:CTP synthase (UTP-ammonia lyase)
VIAKERKGEHLGRLQIIPCRRMRSIMERIIAVSTQPVDDKSTEPMLAINELGGNHRGDTESMPFVEVSQTAAAQVAFEDFCLIHVSMSP